MSKITCPACETENNENEEYCLNCGQKLTETKEKEDILEDKIKIQKDKIILLDLNYTLIANSCRLNAIDCPKRYSIENTNMN